MSGSDDGGGHHNEADAAGAIGPGNDGGSVDGAVGGSCLAALSPRVVSPIHVVRPIYLVAPNTPAADAKTRAEYYARALIGIQKWYGEQMGATYASATFKFEPIQQFTSKYTRAEWDDFGKNGFLQNDGTRTNGCGLYYGAADDLMSGNKLSAAGLPSLYSSGTFYVVVVGGATGGGCGAAGLSAVEEMELDRVRARCPNGTYDSCSRSCADPGGLAGIDPWCNEAVHQQAGYGCTAVGAFAHEIGHGLGLPHGMDRAGAGKTACAGKTLMDIWWEYGHSATLCDPDRTELNVSGYLAP